MDDKSKWQLSFRILYLYDTMKIFYSCLGESLLMKELTVINTPIHPEEHKIYIDQIRIYLNYMVRK
jgi:DNA-directed RNA polymerase